MGSFPVNLEKETQLTQRMTALGLSEADFEESFVRSGGHGGQNVNKVSTCVVLLHRPTGVQVKCQTTRHQGMNRYLARQLMVEKLQSRRAAAVATERARVEKLRRQKRKRPHGVQQRILAEKAHRSKQKSERRAKHFD